MRHNSVDLLLVDIRSALNVGAIFRSAAALGAHQVICSGYTPYPVLPGDTRLPHVAAAAAAKIAKTALGAEQNIKFAHAAEPQSVISDYKKGGWQIIALEQSSKSEKLYKFRPLYPLLLVLGPERRGLSPNILTLSDKIIEIPMTAQKESLNVAVAAGIALYTLLG